MTAIDRSNHLHINYKYRSICQINRPVRIYKHNNLEQPCLKQQYSSFEAERPIHIMSENLATCQNELNTSTVATQLCQTQIAFI